MPMDCYHILLGTPWQYDRHVQCDRRLNRYTDWTNGMKVVILPLIETLNEVSCTIRVFMVSGKEFEKDMKKNLVFLLQFP